MPGILLRLEMGFCLYGNDINDQTSPIEAGLGWITKFTDNKDFIDKEFLLKQKEEGVAKRLKGFVMIDRGIPRQHYEVVNAAGENYRRSYFRNHVANDETGNRYGLP